MNYLLLSSLLLACLIVAVSVVSCNVFQEDLEKEIHRARQKIVSSNRKIEPSEMYLYLRELESLRGQYQGSRGYFLAPQRDSDQDIENLIAAFDISEKRCNPHWFSKLSDLISYHEGRKQIWNYLSFLKVKLGQFCLIMLQNENRPDYFGLEGGKNKVKGMINDRFWL